MTDSLSQSIDKVSKIDKKISQNKFIDNMRSMIFSLTQSIDKVSEIDILQIDKKELDKTFTDSMRSMMDSLSQSIKRISEIDNDILQIDNKFNGNMRSMISSLLPSINEISQINQKISQESSLTHISYVIKILINLNYYYEKAFILMNTWIVGKDLKKNHCRTKNLFTVN